MQGRKTDCCLVGELTVHSECRNSFQASPRYQHFSEVWVLWGLSGFQFQRFDTTKIMYIACFYI